MLSVAESASLLGVSPARVRALIAEDVLPAKKAGRAWVLQEEDVMQRLSEHRGAGRPRLAKARAAVRADGARLRDSQAREAGPGVPARSETLAVGALAEGGANDEGRADASVMTQAGSAHSQGLQERGAGPSHELYLACKEAFRCRPNARLLMDARSPEEAAFYVAVADFFLQQRQRDLVKRGVY